MNQLAMLLLAGAPFDYRTTMNPTLDAEKAAGIVPASKNASRASRAISTPMHQYATSTYSPYSQNQYQQNGYNNQGYGGSNMYSSSNQYPYTNQQLSYNGQYQSSTPSTQYLLRDQNWNYNYNPNSQYNGYSNGYNGQALYNPLTNQYSSPNSMQSQNGYQTNWNTNYNGNQRYPNTFRFRRALRAKRQSSAQNSGFSASSSTTANPLYGSTQQYGATTNYNNRQYDQRGGNANPESLIQNPNYAYLPQNLENQYLASYGRMYDPSGNSNFMTPATEAPILSNDAQNQQNYQKIQQDNVGGTDKYQVDPSQVTNNIYGYDYSSSSNRQGRK
ncbi:unnamed protein product, partial [Mesorhabditis spiculigera]